MIRVMMIRIILRVIRVQQAIRNVRARINPLLGDILAVFLNDFYVHLQNILPSKKSLLCG